MSLQDRIDDEIKNIEVLPDPLTPEQREYLKTLIKKKAGAKEIKNFINSCLKNL